MPKFQSYRADRAVLVQTADKLVVADTYFVNQSRHRLIAEGQREAMFSASRLMKMPDGPTRDALALRPMHPELYPAVVLAQSSYSSNAAEDLEYVS